MFSNLLKSATRRVGVRMALWYLIVFVASSTCLFCLIYILLATNLRRTDHQLVQNETEEFARRFERSGFAVLMDEIRSETVPGGGSPYFVRVSDERNETIFISDPRRWASYDVSDLERNPRAPEGRWRFIPRRKHADYLDVFPVRLSDGHWVEVGIGSRPRRMLLARFQELFLSVFAVTVLIAFVSGVFLSARLLAPIRQLVSTVRSINETGEIVSRVPLRPTPDELGELTDLFNRMLDRIERLVRGMAQSLDNVAHDLRSPIARIKAVAEEALVSADSSAALKEALADCLEEAEQVKTMLTMLMDIAEAEAGMLKLKKASVDMAAILRDVVELYEQVAEEMGVVVTVAAEGPLPLMGDPVRLRQALANLLDNAIKYTPTGGHVLVRGEVRSDGVHVAVEDTGIGISASDLPRIWERLYRADSSRSVPGLGLGLSLVKAIVLSHGGEIRADALTGKGSIFKLLLPLS